MKPRPIRARRLTWTIALCATVFVSAGGAARADPPTSTATSPTPPAAATTPPAPSTTPRESPTPIDPPRRPARRPPVLWSIVAGLCTAMIPMATGSVLMADTSDSVRHAGIYVIQSGFTLAPFVSHGVASEWERGAIFALPGLAAQGAMVGLFYAYPDVTSEGVPASRVPFALILGVSFLGGAAGLIDSFLAGERWDRRRLTLTPVVARNQAGFTLGGSF